MLKINYAQLIVSVGIMLLTVGTIYGAICNRIVVIEEAIKVSKSDHEMLLVIETKLDRIIKDVAKLDTKFESLRK